MLKVIALQNSPYQLAASLCFPFLEWEHLSIPKPSTELGTLKPSIPIFWAVLWQRLCSSSCGHSSDWCFVPMAVPLMQVQSWLPPLSFSPRSGTGSPLFPVLRASPFLAGFHTVAHPSCVVPSLNSLQSCLQVCHFFPAGECLIMPLLWTVTISRCTGAGSNLKSRWKHDLGQSEHWITQAIVTVSQMFS